MSPITFMLLERDTRGNSIVNLHDEVATAIVSHGDTCTVRESKLIDIDRRSRLTYIPIRIYAFTPKSEASARTIRKLVKEISGKIGMKKPEMHG